MVSNRDMFNLMGALSQSTVDAANREFYGRITYPWPQLTYSTYADQHCGTVFLNQDLGDWTHTRIPARPRIWVAGCGSNQATVTALKFPLAEITATDISTRIFKEVSPERTIREVFQSLSINPTFNLVNSVRIQLTTPLFPYLKAVQPGARREPEPNGNS